jgi:hypothetical protein
MKLRVGLANDSWVKDHNKLIERLLQLPEIDEVTIYKRDVYADQLTFEFSNRIALLNRYSVLRSEDWEIAQIIWGRIDDCGMEDEANERSYE